MEYIFSSNAKKFTAALVVFGIVLFGLGLMTDTTEYYNDHAGLGQRLWADLLANGFFFFGISLGALFFLALQNVSEASYTIVYKRVIEALISPMFFGVVIMLIVVVAGLYLHSHHLWHWADPTVYELGHENYDAIIAHKAPYFSFGEGDYGFFMLRVVGFLGSFLYFGNLFRKRSLKEDEEGGTRLHFKNIAASAGFLVIFGYGSSVLAWDILMSLDVHWFSTLFGWYVFSGIWISFIIMIILLMIYLQGKGLMSWVSKGHMHDLGKWMFALSFLWTYLWFSQFMLIWYADIPEEVAPYVARINDYNALFFGIMLFNFSLPMLLLMDSDAKYNKILLVLVGVIIFVTHWMDVELMILPSALKDAGTIGLIEIGMFMVCLGIFLFLTLRSLASRPLLVKNHPYLEESKHIHGH